MVSAGQISLDTGGLIALERKDKRMRIIVDETLLAGSAVSVSAAVVAEWWREGSGQAAILERLTIEVVTERIAKAAGAAIAQLAATPIDAIVMASAALRGDLVYTSDFDDLQRLQAHFPGVRVLRVS